MDLPEPTIPLPFETGPYRMQMGLQARAPAEMIEIDALYPGQMAERRELLTRRHAEVFAACPGSEAARAEVLERLAGLLPARFPDWFEQSGSVLRNQLTGEAWDLNRLPHDPLEVAGRLVQEDLCVLQPGPEGPVLAAAVLCFPTGWRLADKIGRPLREVHAPVPLYAERLGQPVDRLLAQLRSGHLVERLNWSVVDDPALFQPGGKAQENSAPWITAANAGAALWLRTERQTLSALPRSGGVLFTIRVRVHPLARICSRPEIAARLGDAVRALPEEMQHYKKLVPFRDALLGYLDARSH
ncbi:heme-dependent oxidative N-demethylase family protein [Rhodovastum atsumiense]|nr:DUF3445 domain-containing protein [Rhodovastum atsumiense]